MLKKISTKFISFLVALSFLFIPCFGLGKVVIADNVSNTDELILDDIDLAVGESVYYSEETQTFFVDEVSAKWGGYFDQNDPVYVAALPPAVVKALAALGKGALTAVGGAVAKYGLQGACARIGYQYQPFRDFCRANGWPVYGGGGRGW